MPDTTYGFVVDVDGSVDISNQGIDSIKVKFNVVSEGFFCYVNKLTSLKGSPCSVGNFYCHSNHLKSLEYAPKHVSKSFVCAMNRLESLKGALAMVGEDFDCSNNKLTSLEYCPTSVVGNYDCSSNQLASLEYCPESVGGDFYCSYNPELGDYQNIKNFTDIKRISDAQREQKLLNEKIITRTSSQVYKI